MARSLIVGEFKESVKEILMIFFLKGGEQAEEKEFPHMALIGFGEGNEEGKNSEI